MGRPPSSNPRVNNAVVRLADDELEAVRSAAERAGKTLGEWMRDKLLAAAKRQR